MKRINVLHTLIYLLFPVLLSAQDTKPFTGTWSGVLHVSMDLRIVFHITGDAIGNLTATADSPDQKAFGMPVDSVYIAGGKLELRMPKMHASFSGTLSNDTTITGTFTQGVDLPLTLIKGASLKPVNAINHPQEPQPPFPYKSEDTVYYNADHSIRYGATFTCPDGPGPFPAVVLITGSGTQNRDEAIMGHKPFAVIADYLTRHGIAVLRVDDEGAGKTTGNPFKATTADFAKDVSASVDYLLTRPEADKKKIGLIGHSEGGMIAPMVASSRKDIRFIILLAGPGVKITELMTEQSKAVYRSSGADEKHVEANGKLYSFLANTVVGSDKNAKLDSLLLIKMHEWISQTDTATINALEMNDSVAVRKAVKSMAAQFGMPWFNYFIRFDPQPYLKKLRCDVLALNGDKDIQVIAKQNIPAIDAALKKSKSKRYETHILPGLNHLFQHCTECTVKEYGQLEETFSPEVLKIMTDWILLVKG